MGDTRLQGAVMTCKVFVRHLDTLLDEASFATVTSGSTNSPMATPIKERREEPLAGTAPNEDGSRHESRDKEKEIKWDGIRLWSRILQMMDRLLKASSSTGYEGLDEAIPESLKNIVLVMASGGYLVPPSGGGGGRTQVQRRLWEVTAKRLEGFLPGLLEQVFPGAGEAKPTPAVEVSREEVEAKMDAQTAEVVGALQEQGEVALPAREGGGDAGAEDEKDKGTTKEVVAAVPGTGE